MKWNKNRERPQTLQTINAILNKSNWKTWTHNSNFSFNCVYLEQKNNFNSLVSSNLIFDFWLILHLSKHNLKNFKLIRSFFSFISVFSCFFYRLNLFFSLTKMILKYLLPLLLITDGFAKGKILCFKNTSKF